MLGALLVHDDTVHGAIALAGAARRITREGHKAELIDRPFTATDDVEVNLPHQ